MRILIDIPDKDYEKLKDGHIPFSILNVMQNGTPLEQIRDEIEQLYTVETVYEDVVAVDKADVLKIIDKYKGDKE